MIAMLLSRRQATSSQILLHLRQNPHPLVYIVGFALGSAGGHVYFRSQQAALEAGRIKMIKEFQDKVIAEKKQVARERDETAETLKTLMSPPHLPDDTFKELEVEYLTGLLQLRDAYLDQLNKEITVLEEIK